MTTAEQLRRALTQHKRIAIAGVPRAGKTRLSELVTDRPVIHTDDFISKTDFEGDPKRCAAAVPAGPVVIEGVRAIAVAKLLGDVTCVIWLDQPHESVRYTPEQDRAAKGRRTNFAKWLRENRDVEVIRL
jgi:hypothetical protein